MCIRDRPEAVSQAAENSRPAGLPGDFPDMPGHPRRHEGFPGATGCLAAAPAGPGGDGDGHVPVSYTHLVYFFHCPDRAASAPSPSDPLADSRLSGRQEGARGKAGKGKAEGRPCLLYTSRCV